MTLKNLINYSVDKLNDSDQTSITVSIKQPVFTKTKVFNGIFKYQFLITVYTNTCFLKKERLKSPRQNKASADNKRLNITINNSSIHPIYTGCPITLTTRSCQTRCVTYS